MPGPYWGPFPGETPEMYERLGVRSIYRAIKPHFPKQLVGDFSIEQGRDTDVAVARRRESELPSPQQLTKQDRLERYVEWTKRNEKIHIVAFLAQNACTAVILKDPDSIDAIAASAITLSNIVFNVYPIMLQRYNRLKAYRILDKLAGSANRRSGL